MDDLSLFPISNGNHYSNENEMFDEDENEQPIDELDQQQNHHQPIQNVRGGRRKGVPRRLQLSPEVIKPPTQRLLPVTLSKSTTSTVHHHEQQPILTSDQEDENDIDENIYHQNEIEQNYLQLDVLTNDFIDKNNNHNTYDESDDILEIVDDILADIVTIIVKDIKEQRKKLKYKQSQTNGVQKLTNGKHHSHSNGFRYENFFNSKRKRFRVVQG